MDCDNDRNVIPSPQLLAPVDDNDTTFIVPEEPCTIYVLRDPRRIPVER